MVIDAIFMNQMQCKNLNECYNKEIFENDKKWQEFKSLQSIELAEKAFKKVKNNNSRNEFMSSDSRAEYSYFAKYSSDNYWMIAGWNCQNIDNDLKAPFFIHMKSVSQFCDYLGQVFLSLFVCVCVCVLSMCFVFSFCFVFLFVCLLFAAVIYGAKT